MQASQVFTIILLAISCNLNNVGVGIAYGARGIGIPIASNILIALITARAPDFVSFSAKESSNSCLPRLALSWGPCC